MDCAGPGAGAGLEVAGGFLEHVGERPQDEWSLLRRKGAGSTAQAKNSACTGFSGGRGGPWRAGVQQGEGEGGRQLGGSVPGPSGHGEQCLSSKGDRKAWKGSKQGAAASNTCGWRLARKRRSRDGPGSTTAGMRRRGRIPGTSRG